MIHRIFYFLLFTLFFANAQAQPGGRGGGAGAATNGHFYGKILDAKTNKPITAASVQLVTNRRNTATVNSKDSIVNGQLTESNGDFSMENVAFFGNYRLLVTAIGYKTVERPVSFFTPEQQKKLAAAMGMPNMGTRPQGNRADSSTRSRQAPDTTVKLNMDSANLPTQKLTTIIDTPTVAPAANTTAHSSTDSSNMSRKTPPAANPGANPNNGRGGQGAMGGNMMAAIRQVFGSDFSQIMSQADKDLGNIKLDEDAAALGNVTVTASQAAYTLSIDRKVFNVDKALTSQGQTAVEVLRQVPAVNVDIDGNVTLRNSSPTIFVDGRPTTLTLDQMPADAIQSIEVITNPSAKFDASGGTASILNVVMKKNRKNGYNGSIRAGFDSRGRANGGGDFNIRQKKVNLFISGQYGQRRSLSTSNVNTNYFASGATPAASISQEISSTNKGSFGYLRGGFDYFIDNRNTITLSGSYNRGEFDRSEGNNLRYDTFYTTPKSETGFRSTTGNGVFRNLGSSLSYKHNFAKTGHEFTADANYNQSKSDNLSNLSNQYYTAYNVPKGNQLRQITDGNSSSKLLVIQSDYANPLSDKAKIEAGVRAQIRDFNSTNLNRYFDYTVNNFVTNAVINNNYQFTDQVFAAYATYTAKAGNLGYNVGLRAENSNYNGKLANSGNSDFKVKFPISFFPSAFLSYKLDDKQDLQANYTRRINRPNFFQLLPYVDYTDPLNLSQGNAGLKPEFTNSLEANYNYQISNGNNILASVYYKNTTDLITRYQYKGVNSITKDSAIYNTYINADHSNSYGLELTSRNTITKAWDITTNLNFYNATINSTNIGKGGQNNSRFSYFGKLNTNYRFGKDNTWTVQANGDYQGKTVLPVSSGGGGGGGGGRGGGGGGGMFFGGGQSSGSNGYVNSNYGVDLAIKKEFLKNKAASVTLSMNDVLRTRLRDVYSESDFFNQRYITRRDAQIFRLQFSWRFGRQDINLFKRKNMRTEEGGNDLSPQ